MSHAPLDIDPLGYDIPEDVRRDFMLRDVVEAGFLPPPGHKPSQAWMITWNPAYVDDSALLAAEAMLEADPDARIVAQWSVAGSRGIVAGDRVYLMRLGEQTAAQPRGIVAVGTALTPPQPYPHWDEERAELGHRAWLFALAWQVVQPCGRPLVTQRRLQQLFPGTCWSPRGSGSRVPPEAMAWLDLDLLPQSGPQGGGTP